ncbi:NrfD/PsrC family molybdoenzyme membrane anchor subunit [Mycobacterium sp.]|jgi:formate-dependent nitrite reductase membrane component NrfD|uniref:NrfD/PsrC family molybdoenzyme membrane anchor subunit n=1 Tax=Mycobacterium sp. TaxID=1785 RepID=UPI002D38398D|nr:NrfD/PsrC family molybdoenzyme membrane anchor subunit [Mycobacterium sp.]HZA08459.1 NrfD/PsrC family molybdoenzyme membrane anchor subunit [Mycobacterium sp.]
MTDGGKAKDPLPRQPRAEFRSYYGRAVLKTPVWEWKVPAYLFAGGLSAGSAMLAAGADLTGRPGLRRVSRLGALAGILASMYFLVADLGRPERFHHMLRVAKPSSPMSVGTWILVMYGPGAAFSGVAELLPKAWRCSWFGKLLSWSARPAGLSAAAVAPGVASYTAVLLSQTAVPAWHEAHAYLPFVFTGSAAASGGGLGMLMAPVGEAGPARRLAVAGAGMEIVASRLLEQRLGLSAEAYTTGNAYRLRKWAEYLTVGGALGTAVAGRSRPAAALSGLALLAGSALQRFGVFEAGVESTRDPRYVVVPQRERLDAGRPARGNERPGPRFRRFVAATRSMRAAAARVTGESGRR